jgi:hypothetical protein
MMEEPGVVLWLGLSRAAENFIPEGPQLLADAR